MLPALAASKGTWEREANEQDSVKVLGILKHCANGTRCRDEEDDDVFKVHGIHILHISRKLVVCAYIIEL